MITPEKYAVLQKHSDVLMEYESTRSLRSLSRQVILELAKILSPSRPLQLHCSACIRQMLDRLILLKQDYERELLSPPPV